MQEHTIEQQPCSQQEQDGEEEDDIETTRGENKGINSYCHQIKQHQDVGDETINTARISQGRHHSVESCHEDDEDEDVRSASRRKRRRMSSDATETLARRKSHMPSAVAQAQTCTTPRSTASRGLSSDVESILGADYQELPFQGFLKCTMIGRETITTWSSVCEISRI